MTFAYTSSAAEYTEDGYEAVNGLVAFGDPQKAGVQRMLDNVAAVTQLSFQLTTDTSANLRFAMVDSIDSGASDTLHVPGGSNNSAEATPPDPTNFPDYAHGDAWFNKTAYNSPVPGTFGWAAGIAHEIGHALGLKHGHASQTVHGEAFPKLPNDHDSQEYSIMTYKRYVGSPTVGNTAADYPIGLMQDDIAALQYLYGANFTTNAGNSVYTWSTTTGRMSINGTPQQDQAPARNMIFQTIWDGGGNDTYDFSNYGSQALNVDLRPGNWTTVSNEALGTQRAWLGADDGVNHFARGNIANALLYNNDARSLIENAIGAGGNDTITGNDADNVLDGRGGGDTLDGGNGTDTVSYSASSAAVTVNLARARLDPSHAQYIAPTGGDATGDRLISIENLTGSSFDDTITSSTTTTIIRGGLGADTITGALGNETFYGADSNLVVNGGFEVIANPVVRANGYVTSVSEVDGWTRLSGPGLELFTVGEAGAPSEGKFGLDMEQYSSASNIAITQQMTRAEDGVLYRLAFDASKLDGSGARLEVYWGGQKLNWTIDGHTNAYIDPTTSTLVYYIDLVGGVGAGGDKNRLTFKEISTDSDANGTLLDNVRMYRVDPNTAKADDDDPFSDGGDTFTPGTGSDTVFGHGGNDTAIFSDTSGGTDNYDGGSGDDDLLVMNWSGAQSAILYSAPGTTSSPVIGEAGNYRIFSNGQNLYFKEVERFNLTGGAGGDMLRGGERNDTLIGNGGDDTLVSGGGVDTLRGGNGFDRAVISLSGGNNSIVLKDAIGSGTVTLSNGTILSSIEAIDLEAGSGNDFLDVRGTVVNPVGMPSTDPNFQRTSTFFDGKAGNDTLAVDLATSYSAVFNGGQGSGDLLIMDWSAASYGIFLQDNVYRSYSHTVTVVSEGVSHSTEYFFSTTFVGVERFDLTGGTGNDYLYGGSGADRLGGGRAGKDVVEAGAGADTLVVDWGGVTGYGIYSFDITGSVAAGYNGSYHSDPDYSDRNRVDFSGIERFEITAGDQGDGIVTGDGDDILNGGAGNDTLSSARGNDVIDGGLGDDRWIADQSALTVQRPMVLNLRSVSPATYGSGGSVRGIEMLTLSTGAGNDIITTLIAFFDDNLTTGAGNDTVTVGGGKDVVAAGAGTDTLIVDWSGVTGYGSYSYDFTGSLADGYSGSYHSDPDYADRNRVIFSGIEHFNVKTGDQGDAIATGDGNDTVATGGGDDTIVSGKGVDNIDGGVTMVDGVATTGADRWHADKSNATLDIVIDLTRSSSSYRLTADSGLGKVRGIEALGLGNSDGNRFASGAGDDKIVTRGDFLGDFIETNGGDDTVTIKAGKDVIIAGSGTDTLIVDWSGVTSYGFGTYEFSGNLAGGYGGTYRSDPDYADRNRADFSGIEHFDVKTGSQDDGIVTGDGNDSVATGGGNDTIVSGKGVDLIDGGTGGADRWQADKSDATLAMIIDLTASSSSYRLVLGGSTGTVKGIEALGIAGGARFATGAGADRIVTRADFLGDFIETNGGADTITVKGGKDVVLAGDGMDTLIVDWSGVTDYSFGSYEFAGDLVNGYAGTYRSDPDYADRNRVDFSGIERFDIKAGNGNDGIVTGDGDDRVAAGLGSDTIVTGKGADVVDGGVAGADRWHADKSDATLALTIDLDRSSSSYRLTEGGALGSVRGIEALGLGNSPGNRFATGAGADRIVTRADFLGDFIETNGGADTVTIKGGKDVVLAGDGVDTLIVDWSGVTDYSFGSYDFAGDLVAGYAGTYRADPDYNDRNRVDFTGVEHFDIRTGNGNDGITTGNGDDRLSGGAGDDTLSSGKGNDVIDGGLGNDRWIADKSALTESQGFILNLRSATASTYGTGGSVKGIEMLTLTTGAGADVITTLASFLNDSIDTGAGNDIVTVAGGKDVVSMGAGTGDTLVIDWSGTAGYGFGSYDIVGTLAGGYSGSYHADPDYGDRNRVDFSGVEHFDIKGGSEGDAIATGDGNDTLNGGGGNDTLSSGKGNDVIDGGAGNDRWVADKSALTSGQAFVLDLNSAGAATYGTGGSVRGIEMLTLTTGAGADVITTRADFFDDTVTTGAGNDTVTVAGGKDVAALGAGKGDTLVVNWSAVSGYDIYSYDVTGSLATGYSGTYRGDPDYGDRNRVAFSGVERFNLWTGNGNDSLRTGDGNDILNGGLGNDSLFGFGGADTFVFSTALGAGNIDRIMDFSVASAPVHDLIQLSSAIFNTLALGGLAAAAFKDISNGVVDDSDRILYDGAAGTLFFDEDGSGAIDMIQFATLDNKAALSSLDFVVV
ncbi:M10 family metallopeptidase C-terminal domain-containing protein [Zavarzinia aquatilis]|uniref:M10 family metallopeptidase C-terminal domain-containing protein n=1 Tax=Zavarzinia aquatilis TaxID=2211142 RepID=UPI0014042683|nr:M10 family metallopeptidase C-terminal domain-containing protein [Zavarzinia aquatilis]